MSATVTWKLAADGLPDEEVLVLVVLEDRSILIAYLFSEIWRDSAGDVLNDEVVFWADFPAPPHVAPEPRGAA